MEEQKQLIINKALEKFKQYGIKSVSIDDICHDMGMSKKTFYVYFPGKDELVAEVLDKMNRDVECGADKYMHGKSALECIRVLMNMHEKVSDVHKEPPMLYDLKKYYPQLYKQHIRNVHKGTKDILVRHLRQGIEEGVYRKDLDVEMCAIMFSLIQQSFIRNEDDMKTVNPRRLAQFTMESFVRSIVSDEGNRQIRETMNNKKTTN
ncbi:MAG: TetR/AcrR family transcriptional regulator [Paludibacteraceae bacterium]|nr:TetR/AcrR family transcriptional regulator [Paludibacteraceae bacterium]